MGGDLVYVVHPESAVAAKLSGDLQGADYDVVAMSNVDEAESITSKRQFTLPDAILTPLGGVGGGDSILVTLFESNPLIAPTSCFSDRWSSCRYPTSCRPPRPDAARAPSPSITTARRARSGCETAW